MTNRIMPETFWLTPRVLPRVGDKNALTLTIARVLLMAS